MKNSFSWQIIRKKTIRDTVDVSRRLNVKIHPFCEMAFVYFFIFNYVCNLFSAIDKKKVLTRVCAFICSVVVVATSIPIISFAAQTTRCGITADWQAWSSSTSLPTSSGYYYLTNNVTMNSGWGLASGTDDVYFDLNGKTITFNKSLNDSAIVVAWGSKLRLYDTVGTGTITKSAGTSFHRAVYLSYKNSYLEMNGGTITGFSNTDAENGKGQGVWVQDSTFVMNGGTISNCTGSQGAGVYVYSGKFTMTDGTIDGNTASNGGALYVNTDCDFTMTGGTISNNSAGSGGGVYVNGGTFKMQGGTIKSNTASNRGGGVYLQNNSSYTISGGTIQDNYAGNNGGGINIEGSTLTMSDGCICGNTAKLSGGGICNADNTTINISGGEFYGNKNESTSTTGDGGGAIAVWGKNSTTTISGNTKIYNNEANRGGGIEYAQGTLTLNGVELGPNATRYEYSGIYKYSGTLYCNKGRFDLSNTYYPSLAGYTSSVTLDNQNATTAGTNSVTATWNTDMPDITVPTRTGYIFTGYYNEAEGGDQYYKADGTSARKWDYIGEQTLYAHWIEKHEHDGIIFDLWNSGNSLPTTAGSYYLTNDVELTSVWNVPTDGTINLCLNGHVIKQVITGQRVINVPANAELNIYDCGDTIHYFTQSSISEPWVLASDQTTPTEYYVEGGVITGAYTSGIDGGGIYVSGKCTLNSGNIVGNRVIATSANHHGAGVYVASSDSVFTMNGGNIVGNSAASSNCIGGGVFVSQGTFILNDGNISKNYAGYGGAVGMKDGSGTFEMKGGKLVEQASGVTISRQ